jgi:hypothetical protein
MGWLIGLFTAIGFLSSLYVVDRNTDPLPGWAVLLTVSVLGLAWIALAGLAMAALEVL